MRSSLIAVVFTPSSRDASPGMRGQHDGTARTLQSFAADCGECIQPVGVDQHRAIRLGGIRNQPFDEPLRIICQADSRSHDQRVLAFEQHLQRVGRVRAVKMAVAIRNRLGHQLGLPCRDDRLNRFRHRRRNQAGARSQRGARREQHGAGLAAAAGYHEGMPIHSLVRILRPRTNQMLQVSAFEEPSARRYLLDCVRRETNIDDSQLAGLARARM